MLEQRIFLVNVIHPTPPCPGHTPALRPPPACRIGRAARLPSLYHDVLLPPFPFLSLERVPCADARGLPAATDHVRMKRVAAVASTLCSTSGGLEVATGVDSRDVGLGGGSSSICRPLQAQAAVAADNKVKKLPGSTRATARSSSGRCRPSSFRRCSRPLIVSSRRRRPGRSSLHSICLRPT